jgi:homoserine O-acetyltransferase
MNKDNRRDFLKKSTAVAVGAAAMNLTPDGISEEPQSKEGVFMLGDYKLQSGKVLKNAFLSYETHGTLNSDKSNVILYPTWYTGRHMDNRAAIGRGRALDPTKYFIIVPDMFGNGLSSSPTNTKPPHDRARFPLTTTYDNVRAQKRLCKELFSIKKILSVVGFSMSAQQAFHWGAAYPEMVQSIVPICGTAKTAPHDWLHLEGMKRALQADQNWAGGDYKEPPEAGMRAFHTVSCGWFLSQTYFRNEKYKNFLGTKAETVGDFVENVIKLFSYNDANNLLAMLATWQSADASKHTKFGGDLAKALQAIKCYAMVMPCDNDLYFPPEDNIIEVSKMPNAELRVIKSDAGHLAGFPGFDAKADEFVDRGINDTLKRI